MVHYLSETIRYPQVMELMYFTSKTMRLHPKGNDMIKKCCCQQTNVRDKKHLLLISVLCVCVPIWAKVATRNDKQNWGWGGGGGDAPLVGLHHQFK